MSNGSSVHANSVNWKEVMLILGAGAAGGVLSWIYAMTVGDPPRVHAFYAFIAWFLLGTGAGFIGVYVIANSDTRALLRCLGFALICGFAWKPIYEASSALVDQKIRQQHKQALERASAETRRAVNDIRAVSTEEKRELLPRLAEKGRELVTLTQFVEDFHARSAADNTAREVLDVIVESGRDHPRVVVNAIDTLTRAAVAAGNDELAEAALDSISGPLLAKVSPDELLHLVGTWDTVGKAAARSKRVDVALDAQAKASEGVLALGLRGGNLLEVRGGTVRKVKIAYSDLTNIATMYGQLGDDAKALKYWGIVEDFQKSYFKDPKYRDTLLDSVASVCESTARQSVPSEYVDAVLKIAIASVSKSKE